MKEFLQGIITLTIILIPSVVFAADLEITCNENNSPTIVRNTNPLFNITGFVPRDTETREIYIENNDPNNPCIIDL